MFVNNEKIKKSFNKISCFIYSLIFAFSYCFYFASPVYAFGNNWMSGPAYKSISYYKGDKAVNGNTSGDRFVAISVVNTNGDSPGVDKVGVVAFTPYTMSQVYNGALLNGSNFGLLFYSFQDNYRFTLNKSSNNLAFTSYGQAKAITNSRTASDGSAVGTTVYYYSINTLNTNFGVSWNPATIQNFYSVFNRIPVICGVSNANDVLDVISLDIPLAEWPWNFSTSSGGLHFSNGTELTEEDRTLYSDVYSIMNLDNSSTITEDEVNYYNYTYNTNYDYSAVNSGNAFSEFQFLQYVAGVLDNGGNPAGDGNSPVPDGGGSGGSVTVDDSFNPTITVNNNNSLSQESLQYINQIINNNPSEENQETIEEAISNVKGFTGLVKSFGSLFVDFLDLFPSSIKKLFNMAFSAIPVFIILRLIKLI